MAVINAERIEAMIATAITADAEVRRLKRLGEAKHDWCEVCPPDERPQGEHGSVRCRRILGAVVLWAVSRRTPKRSAAVTTLN
jgi:hypothetical protein